MLLPLLLTTLAAATPPAELPAPLPRSGHFGTGISLEPLSIGAFQAKGLGGSTSGLSLQAALQLDLGAHWAFRLPLDLSAGGSDPMQFTELGITPGLLYRWRSDADQHWVPFLGAGLRLGGVGAGRGLLGQPLVTAQGLRQAQGFHHDGDFGGGGDDDPNLETKGHVAPELWMGLAWQPTRWFAVTLSGSYLYTRMLGTNVHLLHERVGLRFSL
ncbi:hypothetical protein FGE12_05770 [Aggregicoccus sp. 17bor-14]|uniref:hypothetical protein n=1 Tax=Myxococcaceae TaxID=31 RepID=UPI00129CEC55|nr:MULTISPECIES: hypothetical protein [Myxococcaceae]MBF5041891.1 hypothetical protein [Simulacricoccus sp. 17bor-14]MRI87672.1 hypothetical protein [Aggregicoccus sp. 17bor-14]